MGFIKVIGFLLESFLYNSLISIASFGLGFFIASLALLLVINNPKLDKFCKLYSWVITSIPDLVWLLLFSSILFLLSTQEWFILPTNPNIIGIISLAVVASALIVSIFSHSWNVMGKGQILAAKSLGISQSLQLRRIIIPNIVAHSFLPLQNIFLITLRNTTLLSEIGVAEIMYINKTYVSGIEKTIEYYIYTIIIFVLFCSVVTFLAKKANVRYFSWKQNL
jgi:ABC-type amino acid transport system permease subunit